MRIFRISTQNEFFKQNFTLVSFFLKGYIKDLRSIVCFIMVFLPPIYSINIILNLHETPPITQTIVDEIIFWNNFLPISILMYRFTTIIIASDLISGDFSNKSAMILYSSPPSRNTIILSKIISIVLYSLFLEIVSFLCFDILLLILAGAIISINLLFLGFLLIFFNILFGISFSLFLSATTRNTIISVLIPFLYLYIGPQLFYIFDLEILNYAYIAAKVISVYDYFLDTGSVIFRFEDLLSFIIFFSIPFIIMILTVYVFNKKDIRT